MDRITSRPSIQWRATASTVDVSPTDAEMKVSSTGATRLLLWLHTVYHTSQLYATDQPVTNDQSRHYGL